MDTRVAVISIIVENPEAIETLNHLLHEAGQYIIGRMGIPYREKGINIISIAIDAPQDVISTFIRQDRSSERDIHEDGVFEYYYESRRIKIV